ncbi:hypothetical protein [Thalassomonas haliotis]|uniref:Uncharacterized protein n=1 Tax=Thalassomonas haliotis TaxID=485448 RepID=A0ABY7VAP6_9GAMM|nr:hypothetical protein [Thalassomonas haliotis]WDE10648.1 hypothetical protein H3N35_20670 [Thalassomonas haliotis]
MIDFEYRLICKALMGDHEALAPLRSQVKYLVAKTRRRQTNRYYVEFELPSEYSKCSDHNESYAALYIEDTFCTIEESNHQFNVKLTKIDGYLRWFEICGDFEFRNDFTVKDVYWCKRNMETNSDELQTPSSERDYEWGFLYAPSCRG